MVRECKKCYLVKDLCEFGSDNRPNGKVYYKAKCKKCLNEAQLEYQSKYRAAHRAEHIEYQKKYRVENRDKYLATNAKYHEENKEKRKKYKEDHKERARGLAYLRNKINRKNAVFMLRHKVSITVNKMLKSQGASKRGRSILHYLQYSIDELKIHIESQFEPWMNWQNHGTYNPKTWNDNDQSTWTWQLDHIVPRSDLLYDSMEHENFCKCWNLNNLRPYSAKQNILDGLNRTRHKRAA